MNQDQSLKYGMFLMPIHNPAKSKSQCYDEDLELISLCEQWGFEEAWVGEHHTSSYKNIVMPEIFLGKAFGLTKKIRLGPAPVCLQFHNPAQVACRLAFLDHLSKGRLNLCFGAGAVDSDLEMHAVDPKNSGAMVAESIDMILKLWSEQPPQEIKGNFWNYRLKDTVIPEMGTGVVPRPLQLPHPPIAMPCMRRGSETVRLAGIRGFQPFSHHMLHREVLKNHWETYLEGAQHSGHQALLKDWKVALNIFVADSTQEARYLARNNTVCWQINYILELTNRYAGELSLFHRNPEMNDADCNLDYFMNEVVIVGNPTEVTRQILQLREEVGPFGTLVLVAHDWDDKKRHIHSLELFSQEVMPALNQAAEFSGVSPQ